MNNKVQPFMLQFKGFYRSNTIPSETRSHFALRQKRFLMNFFRRSSFSDKFRSHKNVVGPVSLFILSISWVIFRLFYKRPWYWKQMWNIGFFWIFSDILWMTCDFYPINHQGNIFHHDGLNCFCFLFFTSTKMSFDDNNIR